MTAHGFDVVHPAAGKSEQMMSHDDVRVADHGERVRGASRESNSCASGRDLAHHGVPHGEYSEIGNVPRDVGNHVLERCRRRRRGGTVPALNDRLISICAKLSLKRNADAVVRASACGRAEAFAMSASLIGRLGSCSRHRAPASVM